MIDDSFCEYEDDNEFNTENIGDNVGVFWFRDRFEIDAIAEKLRFFVFGIGMDVIKDVDEEADRDNIGVFFGVVIVEFLSEIIFFIFVDDGIRFGELVIDDNFLNNVVWLLISCVLLILIIFVVE